MTDPTPATPRPRQVPVWLLSLALAWCGAAALLPALTLRLLAGRLPDPVATHWGLDAGPDGFADLTTAWVFPLVFTLAMTGFLVGLGAALRQLRALLSVAVGMATFLGTLMALSLSGQADGRGGSSADLAVVFGIAAGLAAGAVWGFLVRMFAPQPVVGRRPGTLAPTSERLSLGAATRVSWFGPARTSAATRAAVWVIPIPFGAFAAVFAITGQWVMLAVMVTIGLAVALLMVAFLRAGVVIDAWGVRVRALGRLTMVAIPLAQIESADVVQVHWGEFGGIGLRARIDTDGSAGLITSSGEAVRIHRTHTGPFFLTVSPAAEAASTLNALVARDVG